MTEQLKNFVDSTFTESTLASDGLNTTIATVTAGANEKIVIRNLSLWSSIPKYLEVLKPNAIEFFINSKKIAVADLNTKISLDEPLILDNGDSLVIKTGLDARKLNLFRSAFNTTNNNYAVEDVGAPNSATHNVTATDTGKDLTTDEDGVYAFTHNLYTYVWVEGDSTIASIDGGSSLVLGFTPAVAGMHYYRGYLYTVDSTNIVRVDLSDMSKTTLATANVGTYAILYGYKNYIFSSQSSKTNIYEINKNGTFPHRINTTDLKVLSHGTRIYPRGENYIVITSTSGSTNDISGTQAFLFSLLDGSLTALTVDTTGIKQGPYAGDYSKIFDNGKYDSSHIKSASNLPSMTDGTDSADTDGCAGVTTWVTGWNGTEKTHPKNSEISNYFTDVDINVNISGVLIS